MPEPTRTIRVELPGHQYDAVIGNGILSTCGERIASLNIGERCAVISDSNVAPLYSDSLCDSLRSCGISPHPVNVDAGEASKSTACAETICRRMIADGHDRHSFIIALGGGVVGDLAGFVAAIFYRGIPYVQVPTTIVAQVDSSVGGKTGVNAPEGKNLIGCFHQPRLVLADTATLQSLPEREFNEGFAEVIKHAAIRDAKMLDDIMAIDDRKTLTSLIARNVAIKARIVEEDEKETIGTRAHLNYGHTIGHAIEAASGYGNLLHGEAISLGLLAAGHLSSAAAGLPSAQAERIRFALEKFGLPTSLSPQMDTGMLLKVMKTDKKFNNGRIRFVVVPELGRAELRNDITESDISKAIRSLH
ncbi:MAG: 3-dehydroquinate synthase [Verrucomicrobiales bacterium]|jgi:3-dehydroquinate synthase